MNSWLDHKFLNSLAAHVESEVTEAISQNNNGEMYWHKFECLMNYSDYKCDARVFKNVQHLFTLLLPKFVQSTFGYLF